VGMCPECNGIGRKMEVNSEGFIDMSKSLNEGAVQVPVFASWERDSYKSSGFFDNDKKLSYFNDEEMHLLLHGKQRKFKMKWGSSSMNVTYEGIIEKFNRAYIKRDLKTLGERTQKAVAPYIKYSTCPSCKGARLNQQTLSCKISGYNIAEL